MRALFSRCAAGRTFAPMAMLSSSSSSSSPSSSSSSFYGSSSAAAVCQTRNYTTTEAHQQQQQQHHASSDATTAPSTTSPLQQLYKSAHRGSGDVAMPKPLKPKKLKSRTIPAITDAEAAIFGARSSCAEDKGPVPERALSPLQRRQLLFKNKAAFVLTPQALRRVKYLLSQYAVNHPEATGPTATATEEEAGADDSTEVAAASATDGTAAAAAPPAVRPVGIRIGVRRRGCSGYSYTVNYYMPQTPAQLAAAKATQKKGAMDDVVVEQEGVTVVVEGDALFYVIGTEMDYVVKNVEEKFTFKNPNQKYNCGCEESFMPFDGDDMDD